MFLCAFQCVRDAKDASCGGGSMAQGTEAVAGAGEAVGTPVLSVVGVHLKLCHLAATKKAASVSIFLGSVS